MIPVGVEEEPPLLLRKSAGATLYATRDIAAAEYRWETYNFDQCLYIVGSANFVTGGAANPTLTLTALALRAADHLSSCSERAAAKRDRSLVVV